MLIKSLKFGEIFEISVLLESIDKLAGKAISGRYWDQKVAHRFDCRVGFSELFSLFAQSDKAINRAVMKFTLQYYPGIARGLMVKCSPFYRAILQNFSCFRFALPFQVISFPFHFNMISFNQISFHFKDLILGG